MVKFITEHPDYFILGMVCFFLVIKVLIHIAFESVHEDNQDDGDGGILLEVPTLDLPPGVTLPKDIPEKETVG